MHIGTILASAAAAVLVLAGCDNGSARAGGKKIVTLKHEDACELAGLPRPQRQTIVLIDEQSIVRSASGEFREKNPGVLDAILAVADPEEAVALGAIAPRERVSLLLAPADGSAPRLMFTGCTPALSTEDRAAVEKGSSALQRNTDAFFASGSVQKVAAQARDFRARLLGAVQNVATAAPEQPARTAETFAATPLVRSLRAAPRLHDPVNGAPRFIVIAPAALRSVPRHAGSAAARSAGFAAAKSSGVDLGQAQVSVALGRSDARDFMEAFLLASRGQLENWSSAAPTDLAPPPATVRGFSGTIQYGPMQFPVHARLAADKDGVLTNSWIVVMNEHEAATPMSGSATCDGNGDCVITGDGRGFSQLWSSSPGGEPEFAAQMPFSGLRYFEIKVRRGRATGRVYDPLVDQIGDDPNRRELTFEMIERS